MSLESSPRVFSVTALPYAYSPALYCKKNGPSTIAYYMDTSVWKPESVDGFKDDYCFNIIFLEGANKEETDLSLNANPQFYDTLKKIQGTVEYTFNYVPATLLIGKKPGDCLYLKDGTAIQLSTFKEFELLNDQIVCAKLADCANPNIPAARLDEISGLLKDWLNPPKPLDPEPSCLQTFISYTKKIALSIAQFFVRLFTWNWSLKTCLDEASV